MKSKLFVFIVALSFLFLTATAATNPSPSTPAEKATSFEAPGEIRNGASASALEQQGAQ